MNDKYIAKNRLEVIKSNYFKNYNSEENSISYFDFYNSFINSEFKHDYIPGINNLNANVSSIFREELNLVDQKNSLNYNGVLAYGEVQSGKTLNMIGSMFKAYDLGFKFVFVLTGNILELHNQTYKRFYNETEEMTQIFLRDLKKSSNIGVDISVEYGKKISIDPGIEFHEFITDNNDDFLNQKKVREYFNDDKMHVFFILKNTSHYENIIKMFESKIKKIPRKSVLIIDDESDWGFANANESTELYNLLVKIKQKLSINYYLKYVGFTATPYKIFDNARQELITRKADIVLRNKKFNTLTTDEIFDRDQPFYSGIDIFHNKQQETHNYKALKIKRIFDKKFIFELPNDIMETYKKDVLRISMMVFLINSYKLKVDNKIFFTPKPSVITGLIFTDINTLEHEKVTDFYVDFIKNINKINSLHDLYIEFNVLNLSEYHPLYEIVNDKIKLLTSSVIPENGFCSFVNDWVEFNKNNSYELIVKLSGNDKKDFSLLAEKKNGILNNILIIGGYKISRGVTFDNLVIETILFKSNKFDSTLQRARWFGYRTFNNLMNLDIFMTRSVKESFNEAAKFDLNIRKKVQENN